MSMNRPGAALCVLAVLLGTSVPLLAQTTTADTIRAGRFDGGRMWTFEHPPTEYFSEAYDLTADSTWFRRARLGALRIPGCSASLVSPRGLVMTNHHCAREATTAVAREGENLLDDGFYAATLQDERRAEEMYADQLIAIVDITEELDRAEQGITDPAEAQQAREQAGETATARIATEHGGEGAGIQVEVVSLWNGARTSAYVFRRYTDVRLVMTPELQLGYFGGDTDNFTYPRYALDMTFLRLYGEDGQPLPTPEHFAFTTDGAEPGDPVFIVGNPGSTSRLQTVTELQYRRDIADVALLGLLDSRVEVLEQYLEENPDAPASVRNELFSLLNSQKAYRGIVRGLRDEGILARRRDAERQFVEAVQQDAALSERYGNVIEQLAGIQRSKRDWARQAEAFAGLGNPQLDASVLTRGLYAGQYVSARQGGAPAEALDGLREAILDVPSQPADLQELLLAARLRDAQRALGVGGPEASSILQGRSPEGAAAVVVQQSALTDSANAARALDDGSLAMEDPAIQMARAMIMQYAPYLNAVQPMMQQEESLARQLGRARFEVYGTDIPPDATFSLRIADGVVRGYEYNGTMAPPHTTFYGMYDRYHSFGGGEWQLPPIWIERESDLELSTALNFVSTVDIIGGNSGSPVLDRELRIVGLVFDGNIESLPGEFIYREDDARSVSVDARGILEALRSVYRAERLVEELSAAMAPAAR